MGNSAEPGARVARQQAADGAGGDGRHDCHHVAARRRPDHDLAYDNTPVSETPIRRQIPQILGVSAVLGLFSVIESFGLLLIGLRVLSQPQLQEYFGLGTQAQLQSFMLTGCQRPSAAVHHPDGTLVFPATLCRPAPLFWAIFLTRVVAVLMCGFGWLVEPISWTLVVSVWAYNLAWIFVLGAVRLITERFATYRTARHIKHAKVVNQSLQPHVLPLAGA